MQAEFDDSVADRMEQLHTKAQSYSRDYEIPLARGTYFLIQPDGWVYLRTEEGETRLFRIKSPHEDNDE